MEKKRTYPGFLIVIEGIDGAGKSTVARFLYEKFSETRKAVLSREPGATALGADIRSIIVNKAGSIDAKAEYLLFAANRAQHVAELLIPALQSGDIVIVDRMADSSFAYQGYGRGVDLGMIIEINRWAMNGIVPDVVLYLALDYETAMTRVAVRGKQKSSFEQEDRAYFERVIAGFEEIFKDRLNVIRLDARAPQSTVAQHAYDAVVEQLKFIS